jgi:sarcosine oxidase, subunit beta
MQQPDILIIGGGVIGCSIAYHLAKRGVKNILVVERNNIGSGSTSRAAGGIRQQFSNEVNIRIGQYAVDFFANWRERMELDDASDMNFFQVGYLFLINDEKDWREFGKNAELQRSLGVPVQLLTPAEAGELIPGLYTDDLIGATYCPTDGHGSQHEVTQAFARKARQVGATFWENCSVTNVKRDGRRIIEVETERGTIQPGTVIGCAGAWSSELGTMLGVDIPVTPLRRTLFFTEPFGEMPAHIPMTIDMSTGFYFRREGPGFLIGESDENLPPSFDLTTDWRWLDTVVEHAISRVPAFENLAIRTGWTGLYDTSPDENAIMGTVPELDNFYIATGYSGHGFMQAPATGLLMAELLLDGRAHTIDISELSIERFRAGFESRERYII